MSEHARSARFACPRCDGRMETWARGRLQVEFCNGCPGLFLDRGELFRLFRDEGHDCPPEAHLRFEFAPEKDSVLDCPKCAKETLLPGTLHGIDIWHCTPCNSFLVDRGLLLGGTRVRDARLRESGFRPVGTNERGAGTSNTNPIVRALQRLSLWRGEPEDPPEDGPTLH